MSIEKRILKTDKKIEARKKRLLEQGVIEHSKFGLKARKFISPAFKYAVSLMYPKKDCIRLGDVTKKDIINVSKDEPVLFSITHRSTFDAPRIIAYFTPHSYIISGDEYAFYCTLNEYLLELNGILHFDRTDKVDSRLIIDRASYLLNEGESIAICPEGVPNVYGREMFKLYPGIIKMALNSDALIIPVGNEIYVKRDKEGKVIGDISYYKYEDYNKEELLRPSSDTNLKNLHTLLDKTNYKNVFNNNEIEDHINGNQLVINNTLYKIDDLVLNFFKTHNEFKDMYLNNDEVIKGYLIKCAIIFEYNRLLTSSLNKLESKMSVLSKDINEEIVKLHNFNDDDYINNHDGYINFYLDEVEKTSKKGKSNAYHEIDRFINRSTDESIILSDYKKINETIEFVRKRTI